MALKYTNIGWAIAHPIGFCYIRLDYFFFGGGGGGGGGDTTTFLPGIDVGCFGCEGFGVGCCGLDGFPLLPLIVRSFLVY
jgi:hypothetical protein